MTYYNHVAFQQSVAKSRPTPSIVGFIGVLTCQRDTIELSFIYAHENTKACISAYLYSYPKRGDPCMSTHADESSSKCNVEINKHAPRRLLTPAGCEPSQH